MSVSEDRVIAALQDRIDAIQKENDVLASSGGKIEVGYWHIRGLAAPLRMMCAYSGIDYDPKTYEVTGAPGSWDRSAWFDAKPALKEKNALMNLPYVIDGDRVVTQSNACLQYLGKKLNLMGKGEHEEGLEQQCLCQVMDLRNDAVACFYGGKDADEYLQGVKGHYGKFEGWLDSHNTDYLAGSQPTTADFHLWEMLDQHEAYCVAKGKPLLLHTLGSEYHLLRRFYSRFAALPQLAGYFAGPLHALPINNKMADFGGGVVEYRSLIQ